MYKWPVFILSSSTLLGTFIGGICGMPASDSFCLIGLPVGYIAAASYVLFLLAPLDDLRDHRRRRIGIRRQEGSELSG